MGKHSSALDAGGVAQFWLGPLQALAVTGKSGDALPGHPLARYLPIPLQPSPHFVAPFAA